MQISSVDLTDPQGFQIDPFWGQVKKYVGIIFEKHLKFAMLKTYILPKYYKSSTSDEHLIGRQHCNSEVMLITHRVFGLTPVLDCPLVRAYYKKRPSSQIVFLCDRDRIQTCNRLIRSQLLYSVELRGHCQNF